MFITPLLQQKPLDELRAVSRYLDQQRNVQDRARLFAWLASRDFGAQLLQGRAPSTKPRSSRAVATNLHTYVSGELSYLIQSGAADRTPSEVATGEEPNGSDIKDAAALKQTWQAVLDDLRQQLDPAEYATWLEPSSLVALTPDQAIIGTPHIFARDTVQQRYQTELAVALSQTYGRPLDVQIVIGT